MDESGFSTVHKPGKIVGRRGKKGVHSKTSGERGENISVVCCVSAQGQALPPMIIFKGERISQGLIGNAPPGTLFACSKKSFIDRDLFYMWFEKIFLTHLPAARPVILIMDSHKSHMSLKVIELAKRNDVEMFCLPPHTTHWLQPLDRTIFGPMKKAYDKACDVFMKQNPGRQITRYDFCSIFNDVFSGKMNIPNIAGGFKATGIYPFNPRAICDAAYGPARSLVISEPENPLPTTNEEVHVQPCESYKTHNNIYFAKTHSLYLKYLNCCIFYQTYFSDTDKNKAYTCVYAGRHMSISCADPERGTGGSDPPEKSQNIGSLSNPGPDPLKNHEATKPAFNVGPSLARQRNPI